MRDYRSGRSPGYRRRTRRSSSAVSPRPWSRRDCSSAPSTNACRSLRFKGCRLLASVGSVSLRMAPTVSDKEALSP